MRKFLERHPTPIRSVVRRAHHMLNPLVFDTLHVNEFPKSGGTWLCRLLSEILEYRFDDNVYPRPGRAIVKHHRLHFPHSPRVVVVRDPRDVAVSYYHHCRALFSGDQFNAGTVNLMKKYVFDGCSTQAEELEAFVAMITERPLSPAFTWGDFYRGRAAEPEVPTVRYEDLRADTVGTLTRLFDALGRTLSAEKIMEVAEAHDIDKILANRKDRKGHHFIRQGKVSDWKNHLSPTAVARIEEDAGDLLAFYGYA